MSIVANEELVMLKDAASEFCRTRSPITKFRELRDARLDGRISNEDGEKALVKEAISKHGGPLAHG